MSKMLIAERYARALGATLTTPEDVKDARAEVVEFAKAYATNPDLRTALTNPSIAINVRSSILDDVLEFDSAPTLAKGLIRNLFARGRIEIIAEVAKAFRRTANEKLNRVVGTLTSVRELREEQVQSIQDSISRYTGKDVHLETEIDPALLGGVVVRIGSTVMDGSLRTRLAQLKNALLTEENGQYENSDH